MSTQTTHSIESSAVSSALIIHPWWLRLTHWLNAIAVVIMLMSGWRIYNAAPFYDFVIPKAITLGGWLGGALQWHFAAMWLLAANGLLYPRPLRRLQMRRRLLHQHRHADRAAPADLAGIDL